MRRSQRFRRDRRSPRRRDIRLRAAPPQLFPGVFVGQRDGRNAKSDHALEEYEQDRNDPDIGQDHAFRPRRRCSQTEPYRAGDCDDAECPRAAGDRGVVLLERILLLCGHEFAVGHETHRQTEEQEYLHRRGEGRFAGREQRGRRHQQQQHAGPGAEARRPGQEIEWVDIRRFPRYRLAHAPCQPDDADDRRRHQPQPHGDDESRRRAGRRLGTGQQQRGQRHGPCRGDTAEAAP